MLQKEIKTKEDVDLSSTKTTGQIKISKINRFEEKLPGEAEKKQSASVNAVDLETIKNYVQDVTKNANPIGKIIEFLGEDIDLMNKEMQYWIKESKTYKDRHDEEMK